LDSYEEPLFLAHLAGGIKYAMGEIATVTLIREEGVTVRLPALHFEIAAGRAVWMAGGGPRRFRDVLGALRTGP
jgi:hypothetical protein